MLVAIRLAICGMSCGRWHLDAAVGSSQGGMSCGRWHSMPPSGQVRVHQQLNALGHLGEVTGERASQYRWGGRGVRCITNGAAQSVPASETCYGPCKLTIGPSLT